MFIYEKVDERDKVLYEKVSERCYDKKSSKWCIDRENDIYIVCLGKHGVETPVIFKILYKTYLFEFVLPETDINYTPPKLWVKLPDELKNECAVIQNEIKRAFREASGISAYGSLPINVDNHIFVFESTNQEIVKLLNNGD